MNKKRKILIINTGGTFNKIYNEITGNLIIQKNNKIIKKIFKTSKIYNVKIKGLIYKDSLHINKKDRKKLLRYINKTDFKKIIIVHGTDTVNLTASYLSKNIKNKKIILIGSMKPFNINPIEATSNLMIAYGFLTLCSKNNIYVCMHGLIKKQNKIYKDKKMGVFKLKKPTTKK